MDRRETLKTLLAGSLATGIVLQGCKTGTSETEVTPDELSGGEGLYGRTPEEIERDDRLNGEKYLNDHELATIAILADIICPKDEVSGSATEAGVVEFIDFIVKDMPSHQLPVRGGLAWLDHAMASAYGKAFKDCSETEQIAMVDQIAYPLKAKPEMSQGVKFFNYMRNLVMTGFYTSEMGIKDVGYKGNMPNFWDGVPDDVLAKHEFKYDENLLPKYITSDARAEIIQWDDKGNIIA